MRYAVESGGYSEVAVVNAAFSLAWYLPAAQPGCKDQGAAPASSELGIDASQLYRLYLGSRSGLSIDEWCYAAASTWANQGRWWYFARVL